MSEEKWLLIETAPKNATKILVTDGTDVDSAYWDYDMWCTPYGGNNIQYQPTHWCEMPIPIPRTELEKLNAKLLAENKYLIREIKNLRKANEHLETFNRNLIAENKRLTLGLKELYEENTKVVLDLEDKKDAINDLLIKLENEQRVVIEIRKKNIDLHLKLSEKTVKQYGKLVGNGDIEDPAMCGCNIYRAEDEHPCPFQTVFAAKELDPKNCTCCKKCTATCSKLAANGLVDAAKIGEIKNPVFPMNQHHLWIAIHKICRNTETYVSTIQEDQMHHTLIAFGWTPPKKGGKNATKA